MKKEAVSHTKMKRLCRRLNIPLWQGVGLLESLWHLAARETPRGDIGKLSDEDIALAIDYREDAGGMMAALDGSGWLDRHSDHRFVVHGWSEHCEDGVHMRLARGRQFFADGQAPKLGRLGGKERADAEAFYTPCAQPANPCAQDDEPCAQIPAGESVRTPSALPILDQSLTEPSPGPGPSPRINTDRYSSLSPKTGESLRSEGAFVISPGSEDLWQTLNLYTLAYPDGPTETQMSEIEGELNGTPQRQFVAHLDGMKKKFQPGGTEEPQQHGFFVSTARNFHKAYGKALTMGECRHGVTDGNCVQCLPKAQLERLYG